MNNVNLSIGGRHYAVACGPGEEAHIERLGRTIDGKLSALHGASGQSEARALLFAALLLADEVHELRSGASAPADGGGTEAAEALETLAARLEALAEQLET